MNDNTHFKELLLLYVAGQLQGTQKIEIENHLITCTDCQTDLELWKAVSEEVNTANRMIDAPPALANRALERIHTPNKLTLSFQRAWQLLSKQFLLVKSDMWPASAVVMAMGIVVALVSDKASVIFFLAPLVAASTLAVLYGPENDPALELTLSTPTSPWKILLARLSIVSAYNLLLALIASLILLLIVPPGMLGVIILGWLSPLAFLSALALLLSIWLGTSSAVTITYGLWVVQFIPFKIIEVWMNSSVWISFRAAYNQFWNNSLLLLLLSLLMIGMALLSANRPVFRPTQSVN